MTSLTTWQHALILLSAAISLTGGISSVHSTLAGRTKPNRVTWGLWALAPLIAVGAALSIHANPWAIVSIFFAGLIPLLVLTASFLNKDSYWKLTWFDFFCGLWSVAALVAWLFVRSPEIAIFLAILGDAFAAAPTIKKAWRYPETENGTYFFASLVSATIVLPTIAVWDIPHASFQIYFLALNVVLLFAVYRKRLSR